MRRTALLLGFLTLVPTTLFACSSAKKSGFGDTDSGVDNGTIGGGVLGGDDAGMGKPCAPAKGNWDIPGNNCDDDGDGTVDNPPTCDDGLSETGSAEEFAQALGICATADKDGYGLVSAKFTRGHGNTQTPSPSQAGVRSKFGDVLKPREGKRLGVLSSGYAQEYDGTPGQRFGNASQSTLGDDSSKDWGSTGTMPNGFPKAASGCDQANDVHDVIDVVLELKAPANASGVQFDLNFFSSEWPAFICSKFNDGFIAYLSAKGFNNGTPDNMSFDSKKNPVSVNNGFFDRCTAGVATGCAPGAVKATSQCPGGTAELAGTGYGDVGTWCDLFPGSANKPSSAGGATGWLTSKAPVQAGETFTLEFMIWDTGDGDLDSSVLLDNFKWAEGEVTVITDRPR
jgi:hypothetical protein